MYSFCPVSSTEPVKDAFMELCIQSVPFHRCVLPHYTGPHQWLIPLPAEGPVGVSSLGLLQGDTLECLAVGLQQDS